jgi:hypothetical protein
MYFQFVLHANFDREQKLSVSIHHISASVISRVFYAGIHGPNQIVFGQRKGMAFGIGQNSTIVNQWIEHFFGNFNFN